MTPAPSDGRSTLDHRAVTEALHAREPLFHHERVGAGRDVFASLMTSDFWEVGASGQIYDRDTVIEHLVARYAAPHDDPWSIDDFAVRQLGVITWLATYELTQGSRMTRRATVWTHIGGDWLAVYHQGTPV